MCTPMSLRNSYFDFLSPKCGKKIKEYPILIYTLNSLMEKWRLFFPEKLSIVIFSGMSKLEKLCLHISIWNLQKQCGIPVSVWNWKLLVFCQVDFRLTCAGFFLLNFWIIWDYWHKMRLFNRIDEIFSLLQKNVK